MNNENENVRRELLTEDEILSTLKKNAVLLGRFTIEGIDQAQVNGLDVTLITKYKERTIKFQCEIKSRGTPQQIEVALKQLRTALFGGQSGNYSDRHAMLIVPYLSEKALRTLEAHEVSGVDLCGNGIIYLPNDLVIRYTGAKNKYPDSAPVKNVYNGKAGIVVRYLALNRTYQGLTDLHDAIAKDTTTVSMPLCSKVVKSLIEEGMLAQKIKINDSRRIGFEVRNLSEILDGLARDWRKTKPRRRVAVKMSDDPLRRMVERMKGRTWSLSGASSAYYHAFSSDAGCPEFIVENVDEAMQTTESIREKIPSFAMAHLIEYDEPGPLTQIITDENGMKWAGLIQTWLELQAGDARQNESAQFIRKRIME